MFVHWQPCRIVWRPVCIAYLNSDLDLVPSAITVVTNIAFPYHCKMFQAARSLLQQVWYMVSQVMYMYKARFILYVCVCACICAHTLLSAQLFILLSLVAPIAYACICRLLPSKFKHVELSRPAQTSAGIRKRSKVTESRQIGLHIDICGHISTHTLMGLYFYPRRNLCYAVATQRQMQAWTFATAAGTYARMEYKPGLNSQE